MTTRSGRKRYAVVYDVEGPRVRFGLVWFVLAIAALAVGPLGVALLYGVAAVAAAGQTTRCWRSRKARPDVVAAAALAGLVPVLAVIGPAGAGLAVLGLPVAALVTAGLGRRSPTSVLVDAGFTVQAALFAGLAAGSLVLLRDLEIGAAVALVLLVSAYETGDYLVGTGAPNAVEGPVAGLAALAVVTFAIAALEVPPFDFASAWAMAAVAALLVPAGQLAASAILPTARSRAPALRRLDSLLLVAPAWYVVIDLTLV